MLAPVYLIQDGGLTLDALKKYFDTCQNKNRAKRLSVRANRLLFRANRFSVRAKRLRAKRLSGETTAIRNSNGKTSYFNREVQLRLAAITHGDFLDIYGSELCSKEGNFFRQIFLLYVAPKR